MQTLEKCGKYLALMVVPNLSLVKKSYNKFFLYIHISIYVHIYVCILIFISKNLFAKDLGMCCKAYVSFCSE